MHDALSKKLQVIYISNPFALPRNKNTQYRERVLLFSRAIAEALDEMKLSSTSLLERYKTNPEHFYVAEADLTGAGAIFMRMSFGKWLAKTDRWKPESRTIEKFKQALAKEFKAFQTS